MNIKTSISSLSKNYLVLHVFCCTWQSTGSNRKRGLLLWLATHAAGLRRQNTYTVAGPSGGEELCPSGNEACCESPEICSSFGRLVLADIQFHHDFIGAQIMRQ